MRYLSFFLLIILLCPFVAAQTGHLTLLTVTESDDPLAERKGGTADLFLEMKPGSGQIFIDTFPLTRLDTQSSTRFANRVACSYSTQDCSRYDFFYTIKANSPVIGGPSASAAIAVLTTGMLEGLSFDEGVAMTGTINSGGLIGPVAGEKEKVGAAAEAGLSKVVISSFSTPQELNQSYVGLFNNSEDNLTLNLSKIYVPVELDGLGVEIVRVSTLDEALTAFTGQQRRGRSVSPLEEPESYTTIMSDVQQQLCDRRNELANELIAKDAFEEDENRTRFREEAILREDWYSAASYCFADLISLRGIDFEEKPNLERMALYGKLLSQTRVLREKMDENLDKLNTLAELETYMIVSSRLEEVQDALLKEDRYNLSAQTLGFAYERFNSAKVWSSFFSMDSPSITLNEEHLENACNERLALGEERLSYADIYLPERLLEDAREELDDAWSDRAGERFALCLFHASRSVANANLLIGSLSVRDENLDALIDAKLAIAEAVIAEQAANNQFPVMGYSYFRYASSLTGDDPFSSLTYSEYALELSNLGLYFPTEKGFRSPVDLWLILLFLSGVVFGAGLTALVVVISKIRTRKVKKKRKKKQTKRRK